MDQERRQLLQRQKELEDTLASERKKATQRYNETRLQVAELREKLRDEEANRERRNNKIEDLNMKLLQKNEASVEKNRQIDELESKLVRQ